MTNVFTYGSLMYDEVIYNLVQHGPYKSDAAQLVGYERRHVKGRVYPGISKSQHSYVDGRVYYGLKQSDVGILNVFESQQYIPIQVTLKVKGESVQALAYLFKDNNQLQDRDWDKEGFEQKHLQSFVGRKTFK